MLRSRIIPCLLIQNNGLVKTVNFSNPKYVGDPINAVRIFNEKEVDELVVLDIDASVQRKSPNFTLIAKIAAECRMPLCYGGGVDSLEVAQRLVGLGVEKIALSAAIFKNRTLISSMSKVLGSQSVVCIIDIRKKKSIFSTSYEISTHNGTISYNEELGSLIKDIQALGAGEIIFNSIDQDGCMKGYDLSLVEYVKDFTDIPTTFLGGRGSNQDISKLINMYGTVGAAAGSFFVFKGKYRAVLISYPDSKKKNELVYNNEIGSKNV